jgi:5-methylcytosine-specific restriction endonuclease McrA
MLKSCPYCGRIHDPHTVCSKKPIYNYPSNRHTSEAGDLRHTNAWKQKSLEVRRRDKFLCRVCLSNGELNTKDLSVHHIIPINEQPELCFDNDNLITLCRQHHDEAEDGLIDRDTLRNLAATDAKMYPAGYKG